MLYCRLLQRLFNCSGVGQDFWMDGHLQGFWRDVGDIARLRSFFCAPLFDPAIEQRGAITESEVIQREVRAGGKQSQALTIKNDSDVVRDTRSSKNLLQFLHRRQLIGNSIACGNEIAE